MDIQEYVSNVPDGRRNRLEQLIALIKNNFPDAKASMKYKMPTFEAENGWVAVANQKNYVSLYTCARQHIEPFLEKYPKIKAGAGCINFKDKDVFELTDLTPVIESAMTKN